MSVSQRLEALRTKRDGPRVSFGGTRDDAPKQEAPDRSAEERPMNGGCFVVRVGLHNNPIPMVDPIREAGMSGWREV